MMNLKELNNTATQGLQDEVTINSIDLVDLINEFRVLEGARVKLMHKSFMVKIRKELDILESLGFGAEQNISPSLYTDKNNQQRPCYELTRAGALQMLNSESTLVRYKTVEYINKLEQQNLELQEDIETLDIVSRSDEALELREYKANIVKYKWSKIESLIKECSYINLAQVVEDIIEFHSKELKKKDRFKHKSHQEANRTQYKQIIRTKVHKVLDDIYNSTKDMVLATVASSVKEQVLANKLETANRRSGKIIANKDKEIKELEKTSYPKSEEFLEVPKMSFSCNYMYDKNYRVTHQYKRWIDTFDKKSAGDIEYWEALGVDFTQPVEVTIEFICKEQMDVDNLNKSFLDMVFGRIYGLDDNIIKSVTSTKVGTCKTYSQGRTRFHIRNLI